MFQGMRPVSRGGGTPIAALALVLLTATQTPARNNVSRTANKRKAEEWASPAAPVFVRRLHSVGEAWASFSNDGSWGSQHGNNPCPVDENRLKINWCPSFEFPGGSRVDYLYNGGLWIGGVVGTDTLVSLGYEGWETTGDEFNGHALPLEELPAGYSSGCGSVGAGRRLEQVYYSVYSDTALPPNIVGSHTPMGLEIVQATHQSSDNFARSFVIVDLLIRNIGQHTIKDMYMSIFNDCDVFYQFNHGVTNALDDISGFLDTWPNPVDPNFRDTLNVAWSADNDGDPDEGVFPRVTARGVMGWRVLRRPQGSRLSYNWWTSDRTARQDWGPRKAADTRELGHGGRGTPSGDRNKYHYMSNGEIDYGQLFSAVDFTAAGWASPPAEVVACNLADGLDTRSMLTVGPVPEFAPGDSTYFTFAFIGGKNLHTNPQAVFQCLAPEPFIRQLDFSDLAKNAWWAGFVFDNYGVSTNGDDFSGKFYQPVSGRDTAYYTGDGCPDFSGPAPPQGPGKANLTLRSRPLELEVTWTGINSEVTVDPLMRVNDFEGYKIYLAERNSKDDFPTADDYSLLASWDIVDYRRYTFDPLNNTWRISSHPMTVTEWQELFADNACDVSGEPFDPARYAEPSLEKAYCYIEIDGFGRPVERRAFFEPQDFNQGNVISAGDGVDSNLIQKTGTETTTINGVDHTFGVYKVVLDNLMPSKHYFITVTAFDFGDPLNDLDPLETTPGVNRVDGIPIYSADIVDSFWQSGGAHRDSVSVVVYPNPYKSSFIGANGERTTYAAQGFEGSFGQQLSTITDADRRIHFINLPDTATIRIFTLDGDLVRELHHPDPVLSSYSSKISWDLVSRNTQAVESGIYIYRVDSHLGAQIGKLVIIK